MRPSTPSSMPVSTGPRGTGTGSSWRTTPKARSRVRRAEGRGCCSCWRAAAAAAAAGPLRLSFSCSAVSPLADSDSTFMTSTLLWIVVEQFTCPPMKNSVLPLALKSGAVEGGGGA